MPDMTGGMLKTMCLDGKSCCINLAVQAFWFACYCCVMHLETVSVSMRKELFLANAQLYVLLLCLLTGHNIAPV